MIARRSWLPWVIATALAGCATLKPIQPVTDLGSRVCVPQPATLGASKLALDPKSARTITVDIGSNAPCVNNNQGTESLYHAFLLPDAKMADMVTVSSLPSGRALFAPHLVLLDSSGRVTRNIGVRSFLFRGEGLTALVRLREDEHVLVVESATAAVGQPVSRLQEQVQSQIATAYPLLLEVHTGSEVHEDYILSHTGRIRVDLEPLPGIALKQ